MVEGTEFKVTFDIDYFQRGEILTSYSGGNKYIKLEILENPKRKWYHLLWQKLTFGWYRAAWYYKLKVL